MYIIQTSINRRYVFLLMLSCLLTLTKVSAQCVDPGTSISFNNTGQSTTGYTTSYVLTNGSNVILQTVSNPFAAPAAEGNYKVYAVNFKTSETNPVLSPGTNVNAIGGSCVAVSNTPLLFSVCVCVSTGSSQSVALSGNNANTGYTSKYVVVDAGGKIMSSSLTSPVTAPNGSGEYKVYGVNYKTGEVDPALTTGLNIASIAGTCVNISESPAVFRICSSYDFGNLPLTGTVSWPMAYSGVSCTLAGNAPMPYNATTNPFTAVYGGSAISVENETPATEFDPGNDGLDIPSSVTGGNSYDYTIALNANATGQQVYYRLWFDWNDNGNFADDVDYNGAAATYTGSAMSTGATNVIIPVMPPTGLAANYKVRLAISHAPINDLYRNSGPGAILFIPNGEIEDYSGLALTLSSTLTRFTATKQTTVSSLKWTTMTEDKLHRFVIERSINGQQDWQTLGTVKASGKSKTTNQYSFADLKPNDGPNFYRLKLVDIDEKFSYSSIEAVEFTRQMLVSVFPNPVHDMIYVTIPDSYQKALIVLRDATGRELMRVQKSIQYKTSMDLKRFTPGVYIIEVINNEKLIFQQKIIRN